MSSSGGKMRDEGMSLIEVCVAMFLLGSTLIFVAGAVPAAVMAISDSGMHMTAAGLAQESLTTARRTPFASLPSLAASRAGVAGFTGFDREVLVSDFAAPACSAPCNASCPTVAGQPTCRTVEARVYYNGQLGEVTTTVTAVIAQ
jgi:Tfp pilus assembly protein PilV